jgi:hypothetical protein
MVSAMSNKRDAEKPNTPTTHDIFQAIKHRAPETDQELKEWLASDEGKAATMFESLPATRWGEGRS